jgi:hypothetical protein
MWATSVIFKKLPLSNNRPLGEFSPDQVSEKIAKNVAQQTLCIR